MSEASDTSIPLDFIKKNYGKNYRKVVDLYKKELYKLKENFSEKYPLADMTKFNFQVSITTDAKLESSRVYYNVDDISAYDITSETFKSNKLYTKYLYSGKHRWPKIWNDDGTKPKFTRLRYPSDPLTSCNATRYGIVDDSQFQEPAKLKQSLHNFRLYVNEKDYFMSGLPHVYVRWSAGKTINETTVNDIRKAGFNYKNEPYFAMICGAYIASYLSGISLLNVQNESNLISTFVRYHLYYQIRKFMRHPELIDRYNVKDVLKHIPVAYKDFDSVTTDADGNYYVSRAAVEFSGTDYNSFISFHSNGLTQIGQKLFPESLESFNYCVLGAEARTRWSVVGKGAKSLQTQEVFRTIVNDTIVQNDTTILISNMRKSIQTTNVVLDTAVVPNVKLMPSNFIILSDKIEGYNNILTTATKDMMFGVNKDINYEKPKRKPTPIVKPVGGGDKRKPTGSGDSDVDRGSNGIDSDGNDSVKTATKPKEPHNALVPMLLVSLTAGVIVSRWI